MHECFEIIFNFFFWGGSKRTLFDSPGLILSRAFSCFFSCTKEQETRFLFFPLSVWIILRQKPDERKEIPSTVALLSQCYNGSVSRKMFNPRVLQNPFVWSYSFEKNIGDKKIFRWSQKKSSHLFVSSLTGCLPTCLTQPLYIHKYMSTTFGYIITVDEIMCDMCDTCSVLHFKLPNILLQIRGSHHGNKFHSGSHTEIRRFRLPGPTWFVSIRRQWRHFSLQARSLTIFLTREQIKKMFRFP